MAAVLDGACASGLFVGSSNNVTSGEGTSGTSPSCNYSGQRPYSSEATAALATAITLMMLLTIFGNIMVIIAVLTSRSLRGPQNLFLVSLAAADILVATLIIPFSLANELMGYWYFKSVWCEIYLALDVLFCTSSIVHLCAISLDRYLSVSRAVKYSAQRTPGRIKAAILVVWLISAIISFPPLLSMNKNGKGGVEESKDEDGLPKCRLNEERWYILYSTVGSFFAPCLIMVLVYIRIYQIAKKHARCPPGEAKKKAMPNMHLPQSQAQQNGNDVDGTKGTAQKVTTLRPPHLAVPSATCPQSKLNTGSSGLLHPPSPSPAPTPTTTPSITPGHTPALSPTYLAKGHQEDSSKVKMDNIMKKPDNNNGESPSSGSDTERPGTDQELHPSLASTQKSRDMIATSKGTILAAQKVATEGTPNTRRKAMVIREKRLTFVLAVVIGVFVVCWFPFFFSYSLQAICPDTCQVPKSLFTFFFWIGYCNSSLNPIIYTVFNKDFRRAFKKILCRNRKDTFF